MSIEALATALPGNELAGLTVTNSLLSRCVSEYIAEHQLDVQAPCPDFPSSRAGIEQRRFLDARYSTRDLALCAARLVLSNSSFSLETFRGIVVTTVTGEEVVPSVAGYLQAELGFSTNLCCFDSPLGCNGYLGGLFLAQSLLSQYPPGSRILLVNAEVMSRVMDALDRQTSIIFGDGAAATVLVKTAEPSLGPISWHTQGEKGPLIQIKPSALPVHRFLVRDGQLSIAPDGQSRLAVCMSGAQVFRDMVTILPELIVRELDLVGLTLADFDWFALHQANLRIIEAVVKRLGIAWERVLANLGETGNTTSASLPILLEQSSREGRLKPGQRLLLVGFGTGYSVGLAPLTWGSKSALRERFSGS